MVVVGAELACADGLEGEVKAVNRKLAKRALLWRIKQKRSASVL
jgi:hypothetical protein